MKEREILLNEGFELLEKTDFNACIILPTGTGKSSLLVKSLLRLLERGYTKILYVCDNKELRDNDFPNEVVKWGAENYLDIIERKCYQSTYKYVNQEYDVLLMDEADYGLTKQYSKLLNNNSFKHIIAVSATMSDAKKKILQKYVPVVLEKKMHEIEGKGVVNEAEAYIYNILLTPKENQKYLAYNKAFQKAKSPKQIEFIQRNRKIFLGNLESVQNSVKLLLKHFRKDENNKILIFCNFATQADKVCENSFHSLNENGNLLEDFNKGYIKELSVVGKIDRGKNLVGANIAIFESVHNSGTKNQQKTGRMRRLSIDKRCKIIFIIPFYIDSTGKRKPTIIQKYVIESTKDLGFNFKLFKYE